MAAAAMPPASPPGPRHVPGRDETSGTGTGRTEPVCRVRAVPVPSVNRHEAVVVGSMPGPSSQRPVPTRKFAVSQTAGVQKYSLFHRFHFLVFIAAFLICVRETWLALLLLAVLPGARSFYVPGVAPRDFHEGDAVDLKAVKLTSSRTQLPYEYYSLPFCKPDSVFYKGENLGEVLRGDRIVNTLYNVEMNKDRKCEMVCDKKTLSVKESKLVAERVQEEYYVHLEAAAVEEEQKKEASRDVQFEHGYRLGFVDSNKFYLHNHLSFILYFHREKLEEGEEHNYRVVRFEVIPQSVKVEDLKAVEKDRTCTLPEASGSAPQEIDPTRENEVLFTYSVHWEESEVKWASRWDTYLTMSDVQIHWFSIVNSVVVVFFLSGTSQRRRARPRPRPRPRSPNCGSRWFFSFFVGTFDLNVGVGGQVGHGLSASRLKHPFEEHRQAPPTEPQHPAPNAHGILSMIIIRTLRKDIANYNREDDIEDTMEESGWKNVHGDVFRPPQYPMILSSLLGSGIQLFCMILIVICESAGPRRSLLRASRTGGNRVGSRVLVVLGL
ncbi:Transmembrane 9 superfamily member 4 [Liparis tanakae]|uniref:Transmembrane 9 superfamily member n=1 Tax=Liparis tanakae TaxID=230148 RepID=A0A4Z2FFN1_9TELE|nr:Transmembrane 9 superfamily member 4 [Liparis tanakae]